MRHRNRILQGLVVAALAILLFVESVVQLGTSGDVSQSEQELQEAWKEAQSVPSAAYPETVTYTLAKMTGENNSNMPKGDTYEDNAYTRYLNEKLNVQNEDVIEISEDDNYESYVRRLVIEGNMPDVMIVSDKEYLDTLVKNDLVEDLTAAYDDCTSDTIKEIYNSYGTSLLNSVTYNGKLMALPSTQIYSGCSLFWVRQDWLDALGLSKPSTIDDVENIVLAFKENQMGGEGNIGLACTANPVARQNSNYSMDPVFAAYQAYPQIWTKGTDGQLSYGSLSDNTRAALQKLSQWYQEGVIDPDYMMRTPTEINQLVADGKCGAFFGWWWAPNSPLMSAKEADPDADWVPYLITDDSDNVNSYIPYQDAQYVVVRKGYEHPELVMKIITALFDDARFQGDSTMEMDDYLALGVDTTARPLVINCDYSDAVFQTTKNIKAGLGRRVDIRSLSTLEQTYVRQCRTYLNGNTEEVATWSAYASRLQAVNMMEKGNVSYINEDYAQGFEGTMSQDLLDMEVLSFMKIITGEEPISYYDTFITNWIEDGGSELTKQIQTNR